MSWKGHQDSRISKGSSKGWDTGKSNWNSAKGKGKEWQPYGKCSSMKGKSGSKGKGSIDSVDGITESDGWTQSDVANSEEDNHFCIMEHSQDVVMDDRGVFKVGAVSCTLISVDRLQETGHDVILTKNHPRIINVTTGEVMPLRKNRGMFILDMWRALGEEMECEAEDQSEQDADKVRTISDPGQPSKREREEHEATHAQYRSWCIACVRGRGVAMKHFRNTFADEERLHTFVRTTAFRRKEASKESQCLSSRK